MEAQLRTIEPNPGHAGVGEGGTRWRGEKREEQNEKGEEEDRNQNQEEEEEGKRLTQL